MMFRRTFLFCVLFFLVSEAKAQEKLPAVNAMTQQMKTANFFMVTSFKQCWLGVDNCPELLYPKNKPAGNCSAA